jgi:hypothetical protein
MMIKVARRLTANKPLQQTNATRVRSKVKSCPRRRGLRPRLLAAVLRSNAILAFAAERQVVRPTEMLVSDIMVWRDGGTITFVVSDGTTAGKYRLRTPFAGEPRVLFRDEVQLPCGGAAEKELALALRAWLDATLTKQVTAALKRLDSLHEWRNLPEDLAAVVPVHRIRTVTTCLEARIAA